MPILVSVCKIMPDQKIYQQNIPSFNEVNIFKWTETQNEPMSWYFKLLKDVWDDFSFNRKQNLYLSSYQFSILWRCATAFLQKMSRKLFSKRNWRITKRFTSKKVRNSKKINPYLINDFTTYLKHWDMFHGYKWLHVNEKIMSAISPPVQLKLTDKC